jgi:DNA-binding SARP family transcriptional activator
MPVPLPVSRKAVQLLCFLALSGRAPLGRDTIAGELWPSEETEEARSRLRGSLYELQRAMPPPRGHWLHLEAETIVWNPAADLRVDIEDFEAAARDPSRAREAATLYRGDLVESVYDEWAVAPRERMRHLYVRVLERLFADARRKRAHAEATEWARAMLALDPWREDVVRRLMTVRFDAGDRAGAIAEFRRFAADLRAEIGVDPMPETQALLRAIVLGEARAGGDDRDFESSSDAMRESERAPLPFVGRNDLLERALAASSADALVIAIDGPRGSGTTRLADELAAALEARGARILRGETSRPEAAPLEAIVDALRSALPAVAALHLPSAAKAILERLLPELAFAESRSREASSKRTRDAELSHASGEATARDASVDALTGIFARMAATRPLAIVLDDLDRASETTLSFVAELARRLRTERVTFVTTSNTAEIFDAFAPCGEESERDGPALLRLHLESLGEDDVADIARELLGEPSAALLDEVVRAARGEPLALSFVLDDVRDGVSLTSASLAALLQRRLAGLSVHAATFADVAAVVGDRFSRELVREVLGWTDRESLDALDELLAARLVRERFDRGRPCYAFAHGCVRDAVAAVAPSERKRDRHRRIARVLEDHAAEADGALALELARHFELGGEPERAARHAWSASRRALALGFARDAHALADLAAHLERQSVSTTADGHSATA